MPKKKFGKLGKRLSRPFSTMLQTLACSLYNGVIRGLHHGFDMLNFYFRRALLLNYENDDV